MSTDVRTDLTHLVVNKTMLRRILEEQDKLSGFVQDPRATHEKLMEMMLADGVRPDDNIGSQEILRMREEE